VSTAIALCCDPSAFGSRGVLGSKPLVAIGLISYPLYLWHWPLWSFTYMQLHGTVPLAARLLVLGASFLFAALTYWLVERPVRRRPAGARTVAVLVVAVFSLGAAGLAAWRFDGFPQLRQGEVDAPFLSGKIMDLDDWFAVVRNKTCHLQTEHEVEFAPECVEQQRPMVVLWGDSHASALYPGLRELQQSRDFGLTQWTRAACPPFPESRSAIGRCDEVNARTLPAVAQLQPDVLVLHASWVDPNYPNTVSEVLSKSEQLFKQLKLALPRTKIVVIGPMPSWNPSLPVMLKEYVAEHHARPPLYMPRLDDEELRDRRAVDSGLQRLCSENGIHYISPERVLCENLTCRTRLDDISPESLFVWDPRHLTPAGAKFFIGQVGEQLLP